MKSAPEQAGEEPQAPQLLLLDCASTQFAT
jgi:hypothetical protein